MIRTALTATLLLALAAPAQANPLLDHRFMERATGDEVRHYIRMGHDPNAIRPSEGNKAAFMPLHLAAWVGNLGPLVALLQAGADPNGRGEPDGRLPLHYAFNAEMVDWLVNYGADPNGRGGVNGYTPLHFAALKSYTGTMEALIRRGADIEARSANYKVTPLWVAARAGNTAAVRVLIRAGANVHATNTNNASVLVVAASDNTPGVVRLLLDAGADPAVITSAGNTAASVGAKNWKLRGTPELAELKKAVAHLQGSGLKPASPSGFCKGGYIVQTGDVRLSIVAKNALGDPDRWVEISRLNNITADNPYRQGQCLKLPAGN